jgi:hypothetical protein
LHLQAADTLERSGDVEIGPFQQQLAVQHGSVDLAR